MNPNSPGAPQDLLEWYKRSSINRLTTFLAETEQIDIHQLVAAYHYVRSSAPHRHERSKQYFVGHSGIPSSGSKSNRREEHLAMSLWNTAQERPLVLPNGGVLSLLDYQFPLKAKQSDKGVGKVDLFGVIDGVQPCVIELKIHSAGTGRGDTPLRAYLEALAYCAIVEANAGDIAKEASENFGLKVEDSRPCLVVMAPEEYWSDYIQHKKAGEWWPALRGLADQLETAIGMESHFVVLRNAGFEMGLNGQKPYLTDKCSMVGLDEFIRESSLTGKGETSTRGSGIKRGQSGYLKTLNGHFWNYVETGFPSDLIMLDSARRDSGRPPVFTKKEASLNIIVPPNVSDEISASIEATIPLKERHRWFRSMKSSQAVAQSVFGNLVVSGQLDLLQGLVSEEGLPAFCEDLDGATAQLEYSVGHLGEPRPTSLDVWIEGPRRIAVECKLTEADFGTCSRPRLRAGRDNNYLRDYCDGNYRQQQYRQSRCSLSEIGVRYWDYAPRLFDWDASEDHFPCPMSKTYQLVRNVLAACVTADGQIETDDAHALIIYDARNPSFQEDGIARGQWKAAKAALRYPKLLRSCSWQSVVEHLDQSAAVPWLVDQLRSKYGF